MNTKEIIKDIEKIYNQYSILPNIREHMRRVAAVAQYIIEQWNGPAINRDDIIAACLMHDFANIVKVDFNHPEILGAEAQRIAYWRSEQAKTIQSYGSDEHTASDAMVAAIGASSRVRNLIQGTVFAKNVETAASTDWEQKIVLYADMRVGPFGIISLPDRLAEAKKRYAGKREFSTNRQVPVIGAAYSIEEQLEKNMHIAVDSITDKSIASYLKQL